MLVANLFSQFASDASEVAKMVNYMSALMSAGVHPVPVLDHHAPGAQVSGEG